MRTIIKILVFIVVFYLFSGLILWTFKKMIFWAVVALIVYLVAKALFSKSSTPS